MEAFEHVVKILVESQGFVASTNVKFPVRRKTQKKAHDEFQTHGYEMDIVAARADRLILGSVKSFFGSKGVSTRGFRHLHRADHEDQRGYKVFNDSALREQITAVAAARYGYNPSAVRYALYVGHFMNGHEKPIRSYLTTLGIEVLSNAEICSGLRKMLVATYTDDPVVMTLKALEEAGQLVDEDRERRFG
jgi:hypothetical protein